MPSTKFDNQPFSSDYTV